MSPTSEEHGFCDRWLNDEPVIWGLHIPTHPIPLKKTTALDQKRTDSLVNNFLRGEKIAKYNHWSYQTSSLLVLDSVSLF